MSTSIADAAAAATGDRRQHRVASTSIMNATQSPGVDVVPRSVMRCYVINVARFFFYESDDGRRFCGPAQLVLDAPAAAAAAEDVVTTACGQRCQTRTCRVVVVASSRPLGDGRSPSSAGTRACDGVPHPARSVFASSSPGHNMQIISDYRRQRASGVGRRSVCPSAGVDERPDFENGSPSDASPHRDDVLVDAYLASLYAFTIRRRR
jgi:ferredoxin